MPTPSQPAEPDSRRWDRGWATLTEIHRTNSPRVIEEVSQVAPDLGKWIVEFAYGDCYSRTELDPARRQLVTIGALVAMGGCEQQLRIHARVARNVGVSPAELVETLLHCVPFCGFPRVINALAAVRDELSREQG